MLAKAGKILIIEDTPSLAYLYKSFLEKDGHKVSIAETGAEGLIALQKEPFDLMLLDLLLPDMDGFDVLRTVQKKGIDCPIIVSTADNRTERAVEAMQIGAADFLAKPFDEARLMVTVRNMMNQAHLKTEVVRLEKSMPKADFEGFVGQSPAMKAVFAVIGNIALSKATVFIKGESGTGKEVAAEAIHRAGRGPDTPFVPVNCGAIPHNLFESELFGHKKGSFTGAISDYDGAARRANGGTLFLDEICEMDLDLQTKLLRFLQTSMVQPVGGGHPEKVDVRIVCATNKDPIEEVRAGRFREDLYYRLNVIPLDLPPLRERGEDIVRLAEHFLNRFAKDENKQFNGFSAMAKLALMERPWAGNVRELENLVRQVAVLTASGTIEVSDLPAGPEASIQSLSMQVEASNIRQLDGQTPSQAGVAAAQLNAEPYGSGVAQQDFDPGLKLEGTLAEIEQRVIEARIAAYGGSIGLAAKSLGISPSTIYRKRENWIGVAPFAAAD